MQPINARSWKNIVMTLVSGLALLAGMGVSVCNAL